jgi:hypothetical protein
MIVLMSKEYYQEKELHGKKLRCTLDFSEYNARKFQSDFNEFIDYQNMKGKRLAEDNDLKIYPKNITYNIKDISYDYFKESATKYFFLSILEMFKIPH